MFLFLHGNLISVERTVNIHLAVSGICSNCFIWYHLIETRHGETVVNPSAKNEVVLFK
jgi:hypothetical protein